MTSSVSERESFQKRSSRARECHVWKMTAVGHEADVHFQYDARLALELIFRKPSWVGSSDVHTPESVVRDPLGELRTLIEIVSPGNKDSKHAIRAFVAKTTAFISNGINLLVIDLFPPTPRDPLGIRYAFFRTI
jgi:hypothetical protein